MYKLFVGDIFESLAKTAAEFDSAAVLLTANTYQYPLADGTYYTSLADMSDLDNFLTTCRNAQEIFYCPPDIWSDRENTQKYTTELILSYVSQYVTVHNVDLISNKYNFLKQHFQQAERCSDCSQIWIAGCSITYGTGVEQPQTFKYYLSNHYQLPFSDLSRPGSSIIWQSDQICRADIRPGDKVFWGVTSHCRLPVIQNQKIKHLNASSYKQDPEIIKQFPVELLDSLSLIYHNIMAIRRVENFCNKIGAEIVMLGVIPDWDNIFLTYQVPCFRQSASRPTGFLDRGNDNKHPGPKQHQLFAQEFINFHAEMYL
jgi:hypothetical protein